MRNSPKSRIYLETLEEIADSDQLMDAFADETEPVSYTHLTLPTNSLV